MYSEAMKKFDNEPEDNEKFLFSKEYLQKNMSESIDTFTWYQDDVNEIHMFEDHVIDACMLGHLEVIRKYLELHDVNDFLHTGWTLLLYAASSAQVEVIEYLITNGANINKHKDGYTPLMALCNSTKGTTEQRIKCLSLFIKANANINASNKERQTPLMYACTSQESEFVAELIKYIKNVNEYDNRKQTALMYATIANKPDIVKILIQNAANVTLTDRNNLTAKDIASIKEYDKILLLLNFNEEEIINICETSTINSWMDMFPSLAHTNEETIDFDIYTILYGMGLENYVHIFKGMSLKHFLKLTEDDLCQLGVDINAHRIYFMEQLHKFHRRKWSVHSIGAINKSLPYTLYDGIVSLGTLAKQITVIGSSFQYIKNSLLKANDKNIRLTKEQIFDYEQELKNVQKTLGILKKELLQVKKLSKRIKKENDIGTPAIYIGPKKRSLHWPMLLSVVAVIGIYLSRTIYVQRLIIC